MGGAILGRLVIATHNPGKLAEMRGLLSPYGVDAVSAGELGLPEPEETGASFAENAAIKARAAAEACRLPALADDSGLCVDALGGAPGVNSARWAGPSRNFTAAMQKVEEALREAKAIPPFRAHFACALALAFPGGETQIFEGKVYGELVFPPRGSLGFGYDPVFRPDGHARTFGEMTSEEKHGIPPGGAPGLSHRARAFQALARACFAQRAVGRSAP
ncbi:MAG TPA: RdgB/HAM1 family non-canonical purine NTP pyrophosphatase [Methylocella sp.]|nr:RdgB/HAM1 family non-canonical purine NTP pyrophosphatase [Methylocella sp.]